MAGGGSSAYTRPFFTKTAPKSTPDVNSVNQANNGFNWLTGKGTDPWFKRVIHNDPPPPPPPPPPVTPIDAPAVTVTPQKTPTGGSQILYTGNVLKDDVPKSDFWAETGKTTNPMGLAAEGVINDTMSGATMDAYALRNREALARSEANSRANTAAQIQRAGFAGTPIGAGAANASEAAMLQNRFANNLDIEVQRQDMRRQGVNMAMDYANNANRFGLEQAQEGRAADLHGQTMRDYSLENLSESIIARPDIMNSVLDPMATPEQKQAAMTAVRNDPILNRDIQAAWERSGQKGAYTDDFAYQQINAIDSTTNTRRALANLGKQLFPNNPEWAKAFEDGSIVQILKASGFDLTETVDENGNTIQQLVQDNSDKNYESGVSNPWTSDAAKSILVGDKKGEEYDTVIANMANDIATGKYTPKKLLDLDDEGVRKAVINELVGRNMIRDVGVVINKDGNGRAYFDLWNVGSIVMLDGRPIYIDSVTNSGKVGRDYKFVYLDDGTKRNLIASK
jgi:hypothetical protein